ncbi:response regulator [bacterium]|nr:response regulator [bacterium]
MESSFENGYRFAPNVIPFQSKKTAYWFQIGDSVSPWTDLSVFSQGYVVAGLDSEEELRKSLAGFKPYLIFIESDLQWMDPLELIRYLTSKSNCPVILILKTSRTSGADICVKRAYQAGALDVISMEQDEQSIRERLSFLLKLSKKFHLPC